MSSSRRRRGEGSLVQRKDGLWVGSVSAGWTARGTRYRPTVSSRSLPEAQAKLRELRERVRRDGAAPDRTLTVGQWLDRWVVEIAAPTVKPRTAHAYRQVIRTWISPHIGKVRLVDLRQQHVRSMAVALDRQGLSSTTALKAYRVLHRAMRDAVREGLVDRNVVTLTAAPRRAVIEEDVLTADQARTLLLSVVPDRLGSRWAAGLMLGARQGEVLGLQWDRVDLDRGTVDLAWQLQRLPFRHGCKRPCGRSRPGSCPARVLDVPAGYPHRVLSGGLCLVPPKSRLGRRMIPVPEPLRLWLVERSRSGEPSPHGLVWTRPDGSPIPADQDSRAWHEVLARAGLPDVDLKSLRHTTATLLLELGQDPEVIRTIMGHSSIVTTRGYQHVARPLQERAMAGLGDLLTLPPGPTVY